MTNYESAALEDAATDDSIDTRSARALTECMTVLSDGGDVYTVVGENGGTYGVDARERRCTCPDHQYREATCKHIHRVAYATGRTEIPAWVDQEAVDDQLGMHVEGPVFASDEPEAVLADGGEEIIVAGDDAELIDEDGPEITVHYESYEQGGRRFHRCEACERESIYGAESIAHAAGCPRRER